MSLEDDGTLFDPSARYVKPDTLSEFTAAREHAKYCTDAGCRYRMLIPHLQLPPRPHWNENNGYL